MNILHTRITATSPRWLYAVLTVAVLVLGAASILGYIYFYYAYSHAVRENVRSSMERTRVDQRLYQAAGKGE